MSSATASRMLRTTVFQRVLYAAGAFVILALLAMWAVGGWMLWRLDTAEQGFLAEDLRLAEDVFYADGEDALIEALADDGTAIWDPDLLYEILEGGDTIFAFRDASYEPLAGFPGIYGEGEVTRTWLDHPELDAELWSVEVGLRGGTSLTAARFIPSEREDIVGFMWLGSIALFVIVLPLALATGYVLSRSVVSRIDGVSATAEAVGAGALDARAPVTGAEDEFDRLSRAFNAMLDRIEALNRNVEAVSVGVAHDLKTPLGNIGGRLELLDRDRDDPEAVARHVEAAEAHLSRLLRVFDAMLRLGEVEAGKRRAGFGDVDLSALVTDICEAYAPVLEDADKSLSFEVTPGITMTGDPELLQQAMSNLLENAAEHARDAAQVEVRLDRDAEGTILTVADDGPGITPAAQAHVFERFFRTDASRSTPGNGLGLSLARAITELHGGTITLLPDQKGAVFVLRFDAG